MGSKANENGWASWMSSVECVPGCMVERIKISVKGISGINAFKINAFQIHFTQSQCVRIQMAT